MRLAPNCLVRTQVTQPYAKLTSKKVVTSQSYTLPVYPDVELRCTTNFPMIAKKCQYGSFCLTSNVFKKAQKTFLATLKKENCHKEIYEIVQSGHTASSPTTVPTLTMGDGRNANHGLLTFEATLWL